MSVEVDVLAKAAKRCVRQRDTKRAIELFKQALKIDADRADVHEGVAAAYYQQQDYEKAIEHFTMVSRLKPAVGKAQVNIGAVYNRIGQYGKAVDSLRRGIRMEIRCSRGFYNLGIAYRGLNQLSMAVSAYREAIRLDSQMAEAHTNLANVFVEMGNHQQAILHYKQALEAQPNFKRAERGLAEAERAREQASQAVSPFGRLVDEAQLRAHAASPSASRELTEQERLEDRQNIRSQMVEAKVESSQLIKHLREQLVPSVQALARGVAEGDEAPAALRKLYPQFQSAVRICSEARLLLKQNLDRLGAHEQSISSPEPDQQKPNR